MTINKPTITLVSSFATDRIIQYGQLVRTQRGGPAYYLMTAFEKSSTQVNVITGEEMVVDILISKKSGEHGRINGNKAIQPLPEIKSPNVVVSTLLQEWELTSVINYPGRVFVDIQGYVRDGSDFGKKKYWQEKECVNDKIFCMKGTSEEMTYVPESQLKKQKGKMLVVTKGKEGVEAYYKGKNYEFRPRHVIRSKYAIGAGDTFFANFVSRFVKTGDFSGSIEHAMDKTSELLESLKFNLDFA